MNNKRNFIKIVSLSFFSLLIAPYKFAFSEIKKIINKNLTKKQKEIMFNEGTERAFTSKLLNEKRKGFYLCANCGASYFHLRQSLIVVLVGHLLVRHSQVLLKLK